MLVCWAWGVALPWGLLGQALLTLLLAHGGLSLWLRRGGPVRLILQLGLLLDVLTLTELLAFSGGAANPLASLYLPPVLLAALLSPGWFARALAVLTLVLYGLLFALAPARPVAGHDAAYAFNLHLIGMWLTFALSALLIAGFVSGWRGSWPNARRRWRLPVKPSCVKNSCWRWACRRPVRRIRFPRRSIP
ncbi:hypothetical protein [Paludibacterium denitrificans]|uniref:hypothetical protein n=1 Tax=Paludibacterium denitrificans TaxID=2675226 RepID=UPI0035E43566